MPVPKRKTSRSRRDSRSANKGLKIKTFTSCPQCTVVIMPHAACHECGYYKGKKVMRTRDERADLRTTERSLKAAAQAQQAGQPVEAETSSSES